MTTEPASITVDSSRHEIRYLAMVLVPPLLVVALIAFGLVSEIRDSSNLDAQIAQLKQEGRATSNHELTVEFDSRTSRQNSGDWQDVMRNSGIESTV